MALFNILEDIHLSKLKNLEDKGSYYQSICPNCKGANFKINKSSGLFACYTSQCSFNSILKSLGSSVAFSSYKPKPLDTYLPIPILDKTIPLAKGKFPYSLNDYVFQYDVDKRKLKFSKGYCYQSYINNEWVTIKTQYWNPYFICESITSAGLFFIVEGEKDVHTLARLNYPALTFPTYHSTEMEEGLEKFIREYSPLGFLVLNDYDKPGILKQTKAINLSHKLGIQASGIRIEEIYFNKTDKLPSQGYDISDYIQDFYINDLNHIWNPITNH